jgi:hypothetical protein
MVDPFDQGGFSISYPSNPSDETVNLPLAQRRVANLGALFTTPGATMTSTLDSATGTFRFVVNGNTASNAPLAIELIYSGGGPYNISSCTSFILGFSEMSGVGSLYVEVGSSDGLTGEHRVDLTGQGDVNFSVPNVKPNNIHSVDSFDILRFVFEARSTDFSFTLNEIRLVPEPSGTLLLAAGFGLFAQRRRNA